MTASLVAAPARLARRRATYRAAAVMLALGTSLAASAEDAIVYSPWGKFCGKDNGNPAASEVCITVKEARLETGQFLAGASLIEQAGDEKKLFRITLPLGVQLPQGARMILDQEEPMSGRYLVCLPNGCMADFDVTADFVRKLKDGRQLQLHAVNLSGQKTSYVLPLADFAKANEGPATDPKVWEERQKTLQKELEQKAQKAQKAQPRPK